MKLQEADIGIEQLSAIKDAGDRRPEKFPERRSDPPASRDQRAGKGTRDQEYATSMEERYGIPDEGLF